MAKAADTACIQYRLLNRGKGPAVHSLRAQADRRLYQQVMKHTLERQENLTLRQGEVTEIRLTGGAAAQQPAPQKACTGNPATHFLAAYKAI